MSDCDHRVDGVMLDCWSWTGVLNKLAVSLWETGR